MSIVTKTGDEGLTSLFSGERVWKDDLTVEAYGTMDELSSLLGFARQALGLEETKAAVESIQRDLVRVSAELASRGRPFANPMGKTDDDRLTSMVRALEARIPIEGFVLPGMTEASARLDLARTVARRAERRVISLSRQVEVSVFLRRYLNRLSDLLFMLARAEEAAVGALKYV